MSIAKEIDIKQIISRQLIESHFQPIVSVRKRKTIGLEALARYTSPATGQPVSPVTLFSKAAEQGLSVELDRLCRQTALQNFKSLVRQNPDLLLFLNLDTAVIDQGVVGSGHLMNAVENLELNPHNIVIEIIESKVGRYDGLKQFIKTYKDYGFILALDDLGLGHSNLDRILHIKPDIIKLDRCLVQNLDQDYYKQEICKALVNMSKKIGALVVAECVETMAEAVACLELGIDMLQGYYFARPRKLTGDDVQVCNAQSDLAARHYKERKVANSMLKKRQWSACHVAVNSIVTKLRSVAAAEFDVILKNLIDHYPMLEYVYVLDENGRQVTETIGRLCDSKTSKKMFRPDCRGTDQSLKEYFLNIQAGWKKYTTEPYMSLATGNLCITNSTAFRDEKGEVYVLCTDFSPGFYQQ